MALNRSNRGSNDAAPTSQSAIVVLPAVAVDEDGTSRSSIISIKRCSSAARASSAASSATVRFRDFGAGGSSQESGSCSLRNSLCASWGPSTGSKNKGGAVAAMSFSSRSDKSFPLNIIFCFFVEGPASEGVEGTAEDGVGGWGMVAEAGVRAFICDCFRLLAR